MSIAFVFAVKIKRSRSLNEEVKQHTAVLYIAIKGLYYTHMHLTSWLVSITVPLVIMLPVPFLLRK
jgi:NO-binding membrane sensor protein with MHYT domain